MFDDLDEQGEQLLGSLHLGPAEEELPVRRGAASRANSVRFDESALHGSSWSGHNNRHSGDFGPPRPSSGMMMERSLSHKSDGRHSSAGHSVHSHHSVASGRASSFGLDTNFAAVDDDDDDSSFDIPRPPVSFYVLGTVPSIVRCWLTTHYAHGTLLYADVCSGSQKSTVEYSLIKELDLLDEVQRDGDGLHRIRLNVYLAEAVVTRHGSRSDSPEGSVPSMTVLFEVVGAELSGAQVGDRKPLRIFIGSDALRAHSADILFSQNSMVLYGNERERLRVPFVRPEDEAVFRHITASHIVPDKPKLNATAAPFVVGETNQAVHDDDRADSPDLHAEENGSPNSGSPTAAQAGVIKAVETSSGSELSRDGEKSVRATSEIEITGKEGSTASETSRRGSSAGIWGSWRQGAGAGPDGTGQSTSLSGYQPAARGTRNMKVLKPHKSGSISARPGTSYEPAPPTKSAPEGRRKSQASGGGEGHVNGSNRWETKRAVSTGSEPKPQQTNRENRNAPSLPRSANPVGVASAFSWMTPPTKTKSSTTATD